MYSLSEREILFIGAGKRNTVLQIERVRNINRSGRHHAEWSDADYYFARKKVTSAGMTILCEGHSHPTGLRHPSVMDIKAIPTGVIELICFPKERVIRAWVIQNSLSATLKSEVILDII